MAFHSTHYEAKLIKVIDGDSLRVKIMLGFNVEITTDLQLSGLDAIELIGANGREARLVKKELTEWLRAADMITIQPTGGTTGAGRWYARVDVQDADGKGFCVNDELYSRSLAHVSMKS